MTRTVAESRSIAAERKKTLRSRGGRRAARHETGALYRKWRQEREKRRGGGEGGAGSTGGGGEGGGGGNNLDDGASLGLIAGLKPDWRQGKLRRKGMSTEAAMEATRVANAAARERQEYKGDRREEYKARSAGRVGDGGRGGEAAMRKERLRRKLQRNRGRGGGRGRGRGRNSRGGKKLGPTQPRPSKVRKGARGRSVAIVRRR